MESRALKTLLFPLRYGVHRVGDALVPYTQAEIDAYVRSLTRPFADDLAACAETNS